MRPTDGRVGILASASSGGCRRHTITAVGLEVAGLDPQREEGRGIANYAGRPGFTVARAQRDPGCLLPLNGETEGYCTRPWRCCAGRALVNRRARRSSRRGGSGSRPSEWGSYRARARRLGEEPMPWAIRFGITRDIVVNPHVARLTNPADQPPDHPGQHQPLRKAGDP